MQKNSLGVRVLSTAGIASLVLAGCFGGDNKNTAASGDSDTAAALALTEAVSFDNGKLVPGLMPASDTTSVSLFPLTSGSVTAGDATLLSFDLENPDDKNGVLLSLVQFEGASKHFEVDATGGQGSDAGTRSDAGADDAGVGGGTHNGYFALSYKVGAKVCSKLCSKTFKIKVVEAVKLKNGQISKHAMGAIMLDCTKQGDPKQCGSTTKGGAGSGDVPAGATKDAGSDGVAVGAPDAGRGGAAGSSSFPNYCDGGAASSGSGRPSSGDTACNSCMMTQCNAEASSAYGANWAKGDFSGGPCGPFFGCSLKCCGDATCAQGCVSSLTASCQDAITPLDSCITMFCTDLCGGSSGGADASVPSFDAGVVTGGTCKDLAACCAAATFPASSVSTCQSLVGSANDANCGSAYTAFKSAGYCP